MRIGFIGAGRVGTAFGIYLRQKGFVISGYNSRTEASGISAAERTESRYYSDLKQLIDASDLLFITSSDDQIGNVVNQLCNTCCLRRGHILAHMSGALSSEILKPAKALGCYIYSLHPLQAFADIEKSVCDLEHTSFCLEGDEEKISVLESLLTECNNSYFKLKPEQKVLYHASACIFSNFLVTLIHNGLKLMENIQVDSNTAYKAMLPLINSTLQNVSLMGAAAALTGPIARGDIGTLAKQLEAISTSCNEQLKLYTFMSEETLKLAELSKLRDSKTANELKSLIELFI